MGDLTKNFSKSEFACKCGCGFDDIDINLVNFIQGVRDILGVPISINSGCRCAKHNAKVGGVGNSFHTKGKAADLSSSVGAVKIFNVCKALHEELKKQGKKSPVGYCKRYINKNFVHVDVGNKHNGVFAEGD